MNKEFDIELLKREYKIRFSENWIAKKNWNSDREKIRKFKIEVQSVVRYRP